MIEKVKLSYYEGFVYLAHCGTGHYKIGMSQTPVKRIRHFDTKMPVNVNLIHSFYTDNRYAAEKSLQERFSHWRQEGEWFLFPPELEQIYVNEIKEIFAYVAGQFHFVYQIMPTYSELLSQIAKGELIPSFGRLPY